MFLCSNPHWTWMNLDQNGSHFIFGLIMSDPAGLWDRTPAATPGNTAGNPSRPPAEIHGSPGCGQSLAGNHNLPYEIPPHMGHLKMNRSQ